MMYKGGKKVDKGTYWNPADGHRVDMRGEGVLPGGPDTTYLRMPPGGMILMAPVVGLLYVIFLPVFGLMAILGMWLVPVVGVLTGAALTGVRVCSGMFAGASRSVPFGYAPSAAYLAGKKRAKKKEEKKEEKKS